MNSKTIISSVMAVCLTASGLVFGQGYERDRGHDEHMQRGPGGERGQAVRPRGNEMRAHEERHEEGRGAGPRHDMFRGGRLPDEYRSRQYVVDDWRAHRLSRPPRGYHWVQVGADYVLVGVATGIILETLLSNQ